MPALIHGVGTFGKQTRAYTAWTRMRNRCNNPNTPDYPYYGGRGIRVCKRWDEFLTFLADMGEPPIGQTLDRIDGDKNYEPSNCRWASRKVQSRNRAYCKLTLADAEAIRTRYAAGGVRQQDLAEEFRVTQGLVSQITRGAAWV